MKNRYTRNYKLTRVGLPGSRENGSWLSHSLQKSDHHSQYKFSGKIDVDQKIQFANAHGPANTVKNTAFLIQFLGTQTASQTYKDYV